MPERFECTSLAKKALYINTFPFLSFSPKILPVRLGRSGPTSNTGARFDGPTRVYTTQTAPRSVQPFFTANGSVVEYTRHVLYPKNTPSHGLRTPI